MAGLFQHLQLNYYHESLILLQFIVCISFLCGFYVSQIFDATTDGQLLETRFLIQQNLVHSLLLKLARKERERPTETMEINRNLIPMTIICVKSSKFS